jgi:hypothetical protein
MIGVAAAVGVVETDQFWPIRGQKIVARPGLLGRGPEGPCTCAPTRDARISDQNGMSSVSLGGVFWLPSKRLPSRLFTKRRNAEMLS